MNDRGYGENDGYCDASRTVVERRPPPFGPIAPILALTVFAGFWIAVFADGWTRGNLALSVADRIRIYPVLSSALIADHPLGLLGALLGAAAFIRVLELEMNRVYLLGLLGVATAISTLSGAALLPPGAAGFFPLTPSLAALGALWHLRRGTVWPIGTWTPRSRTLFGVFGVGAVSAPVLFRMWAVAVSMAAAVLAGYALIRLCEWRDRFPSRRRNDNRPKWEL